jgi:hypothetical protein
MNRSAIILGISVTASALAVAGERDAAACGGCFQPPPPPTQTTSDITDERMLLSVSPTQSTLYDQIRYSGAPSSFAWVLPIHGTVDVGLSADVLFDSVDTLTATQINPPPSSCPPPPKCNTYSNASAGFSGASQSANLPAVTVTKQENVGPYATVQLHATDSSALNGWLTQNGYVIPADAQLVVDQYVKEGFDFLAMKLLPNQGVQSMRPVRVSTPGASLSLPLRMASVGTGNTVGITIWIVSDGRYEPQNFPFFHIDDSELVWDWSKSLSNYTSLRAQHEAALGQKGWEIESSLSLNEQAITNVILSGGQYYGYGGGIGQVAPSDPAQDYLAIGDPDAGPDAGMTAEEVRTADVNALFVGMTGPNVRVTRVRSDIAHAAMTADLVFQASADQSELSNVRNLTRGINETCSVYNGCTYVGTGSPAQAAAASGSGGGGQGCVASAPAGTGSAAGLFGALAGLTGLASIRNLRARRRRVRERRE